MSQLSSRPLAYLAAPYSDPDKQVVEARIKAFCIADAALMKRDIMTVSPLLKCLILGYSDLPSDWNYWQDYSINLLALCDYMIVLRIPGWKESSGVQGEIEMAKSLIIPVYYVNPEDINEFDPNVPERWNNSDQGQ